MWKILIFEISAKNGFCDVILGSEENFGFGSALFTQFWRCKTVLFTIQTFNEHSRMTKLSQPYLRGHMR